MSESESENVHYLVTGGGFVIYFSIFGATDCVLIRAADINN